MNDKLVRALKTNPVKFAKLLGWTKLTDIHNEWIKLMANSTSDYTLLGHRESYKTTCLSVAIALLLVLRPNKTIFFFRKTDDDAAEIIKQVIKTLESDLFKYIVREIYGVELKLTTATYLKIDTNLRSNNKGQCQLQGMGIYGSMTGKHADIIFTDDIVNDKDRASKATREQTKRAYMELQNVKNRGGRLFNTGTPWHEDDAISSLMPNVHKWTCYDTGLFTDEELEYKRNTMTASLFAANYELKHIADKDALFTSVNKIPATEENIKLIYNGFGHVDAAYDGEDYTAFTIMKQQKDGRIIAYGRMWNMHVDKCLPMIKTDFDRYRAGIMSCEKNADKGYLAGEMRTAYGIHTLLYSENMNKYVKIATYLLSNWNNVYWLDNTDEDYITQILNYTAYSEHDDAPDSAASLVRFIKDKPKANTGKHLKGGW